jgi:hypothetical protein
MNRHSCRNRCELAHTNRIFPTILRAGVLSQYGMALPRVSHLVDYMDCDNDDEGSDSDNDEGSGDERNDEDDNSENDSDDDMLGDDDWLGDCVDVEMLKNQIVQLQKLLRQRKTAFKNMKAEMNKRLKIAQAKQFKKGRNTNLEAHCLSLSEALKSLIPLTLSKKATERRLAKFFVKIATDTRVKGALIQYAKEVLSQREFHPFKVLRLMDTHGGKINIEALALLRSLEEPEKRKHNKTVIPSKFKLQELQAKVHRLGDLIARYKKGTVASTGNEYIEFFLEDALRCILTGTGLHTIHDQDAPVTLSQVMDGSRFSNAIHFVMYGIKINDPRALCPWTKERILDPSSLKSNLQSRNNQIPLKLMIGREKGNIYEELETLMTECKSLESFQFDKEDLGLNVAVNLKSVNTDMSASWKAIGRGGACKVRTFFCHCCATKSEDAIKANTERCPRCVEKAPSWKCYHKTFLTDSALFEGEVRHDAMLVEVCNARLLDLDEWVGTCQLCNTEDPRVHTESSVLDAESVHYNYQDLERDSIVEYYRRVRHDLELRDMLQEGEVLASMQQRLKQAMIEERKFRELVEQIKYAKGNGEGYSSLLFEVMQNVPCVLHMYMRIFLKLLGTLFQTGLSNALSGRLDNILFGEGDVQAIPEQYRTEKKRFELFVETIGSKMSNEVLGDAIFPVDWSLAVDPQTRKLLPFSLEGHKCKRAIAGIKVIIDICVEPIGNQQERFQQSFTLFEQCMTFASQKTPFSNEEIEAFQDSADAFCQLWFDMQKIEGCTNYIHMLSSGHIRDYLLRHRNLYIYSNQGWEAMNSLVKTVFFRRTQRGGGKDGFRSRLVGLARWLQRRLVFMVVQSYEELITLYAKELEKSQEATPPVATANDFLFDEENLVLV